MTSDPDRVTLADCADEPIHRPGAVQPHGALLVFDGVPKLVARSANCDELIGDLEPPPLGGMLGPEHLGGHALAALQDLAGGRRRGASFPIAGAHGTFDVVAHVHEGLTYVEFERRHESARPEAGVAFTVQQVASRLRQRTELGALLQEAAVAIRELTGFDRVMAYRFLPDEAGEVVAETRRADLEPFLGLRYPASDIPAQARRLYLLNRVRSIPDVRYAPVPMEPADGNPVTGGSFDMSHCMLRSVSPIHVEYLGNMGVGASMSISLVVDDRLWGLIACHHMAPHYPPLNVRLSCLVLSEHLSLLVAKVAEEARGRTLRESAAASTRLVERAADADDLIEGVIHGSPTLLDVVAADGAAVALGGRIATIGRVPPRVEIRRLVEHLSKSTEPLHRFERADEWRVGDEDRAWSGLLAGEFFRDSSGYLMWFRQEQVRHVRWAGNPDKEYGAGPNGARLTPRGSFDEWKELARGAAEPWQAGEVDAVAELRTRLQRVALQRVSKLERMQSLLIGVLGHDLRTPLHAITLSAELLAATSEIGNTIKRSTSRMRAMIDKMLDYARLANNEGLSVAIAPQDLHAAARVIVDEAVAAFPGCEVRFEVDGDPVAEFDATRMGQLLANLLSNARHHGDASRPILVSVGGDERVVRVQVANHGAPIPPEQRDHVFDAFASVAGAGGRNQERVGLGLFICRAIARAHGGTIDFRCEEGVTTFVVCFPRTGRR